MKPYKHYQLEELQQAREYIDKHWGCTNAHAVTRTVVFEDGQAATFYGLTHDTSSVCAVVLPFGESYVRLVHYSTVKPFPAESGRTYAPGKSVVTRCTSEPNLDDRDATPVEFTESPAGQKARDTWAEDYDALNGAPESDDDR